MKKAYNKENYPYLSQARDFEQLKERYSEETLTEFEAAICEYEETENPKDYEETGLDPIVSWYEGLLDTSDLFGCYELDYNI